MINREMRKLGGSELLYFICYTIICANFQEWWKNGLLSSYLNVIVQNVFHGLTPYFWDFPGAQILVDLHSNNSAWENPNPRQPDAKWACIQMKRERETAGYMKTSWLSCTPPEATHSVRGPAVTRLYFVWFLSLLHWCLKKKNPQIQIATLWHIRS